MTKDSTTAAEVKDLIHRMGIESVMKTPSVGSGDLRQLLVYIQSLEAKLKIARGALGNANTAFSNILRDKEYESFTLEDFKFHMKVSGVVYNLLNA